MQLLYGWKLLEVRRNRPGLVTVLNILPRTSLGTHKKGSPRRQRGGPFYALLFMEICPLRLRHGLGLGDGLLLGGGGEIGRASCRERVLAGV